MPTIERCIHQIFNSKTHIKLPSAILAQLGRGNCSECTYNPEENSQCSGCYMSPVRTIVVKSKINEEVYMTE